MMKLSHMLSLTTLVLTTVFSSVINADDSQTDSKIKLYTRQYGGAAPGSGLGYDGDVSLVIEGQLIIAKNTPRTNDRDFRDSYVEVDAALNYKEITSAEFNWMTGGKKYHCVAKNLPLYVQDGDLDTGTSILYECK